ncbi:zinc finger protein 862-like [Ruditapes philippinarum]|uniref:zinc finger protein 862-like n=1 Tax=Ruditapes philippinarum TaxID=129788 RepID=UPI00295AA469|nr:zinc finger protein 862-like [Ruditapes philippinarum]
MTINAVVIDPESSCPNTIYLRNVEYEDGTGVGLASVIVDEFSRRNISFDKLLGFGSDGASVMTGSDRGVKGILLRKQPHMIHIHCMAHRLALFTSQAAKSVPNICEYQRFLTNLFYYFKASPSREQELHQEQAILNHLVLKYKEIHAVRWLSCYEAVLYRTIDPLLSYLHQRVAAKDPKSKGLLKKMASTQFVYITYLMMDVLPIVMKLCLKYQEKSLDIGQAKVC